MKLNNLYVSNTSEPQRTLLYEGLITDLLKSQLTKARTTILKNKHVLEKVPELQKLFEASSNLDDSLLKYGKLTEKWWHNFFNHFNIPESHRGAILRKLLNEIRPKIDLSSEIYKNTEDEYEKERAKQVQAEGIISENLPGVNTVLDAAKKALTGKGRLDVLDAIIQIVDKKSRNTFGKKLVQKSNNEYIAALAINSMVEKVKEYIQTAVKRKNYDVAMMLAKSIGEEFQTPEEDQVLDPKILDHKPDNSASQEAQAAQKYAIRLWQRVTLYAHAKNGIKIQNISSDKALQFDKNAANDLTNKIGRLGFRIIWRGEKKDGFPNGDKPPHVRPLKIDHADSVGN